eukprot:CAMPEP_0202703366 /NCGR_PEP_ID=MMETSP1385-20130828/16207_1 /ASSEMBLY_ACC=CAM_ASM_000861 /TAXON_ID=933848 /ORGANISM="Elphidium margaritaceum" /LENGTH=423 /DNA_ID=CAMNT_0049361203 /DNA_START=196 /DNA_END=1464 /DNA_ORIENTATION=-
MTNVTLQLRVEQFIASYDFQRNARSVRFWRAFYRRQKRLHCVAVEIETKRHLRDLSAVFYAWCGDFRDKQRFRALQQYADELCRQQRMTLMFVQWRRLLPLLRRERIQLQTPELMLNFLRWRQSAAYHNNMRDNFDALLLAQKRKYFVLYRRTVLRSIQRKQIACASISNIYRQYHCRLACNMWMQRTQSDKQLHARFALLRHKHDTYKKLVIYKMWLLLMETGRIANHKRLKRALSVWQTQYHNLRNMHSIQRRRKLRLQRMAWLQWTHLLRVFWQQQVRYETLCARNACTLKGEFFAMWHTQYKLRQIWIESNRAQIADRIRFWRYYARHQRDDRESLHRLQSQMSRPWSHWPSSICSSSSGSVDCEEQFDVESVEQNGEDCTLTSSFAAATKASALQRMLNALKEHEHSLMKKSRRDDDD